MCAGRFMSVMEKPTTQFHYKTYTITVLQVLLRMKYFSEFTGCITKKYFESKLHEI